MNDESVVPKRRVILNTIVFIMFNLPILIMSYTELILGPAFTAKQWNIGIGMLVASAALYLCVMAYCDSKRHFEKYGD